MIKKFISYYKPYKKLFFLDLIVATIATLCNLIYPMMTRDLMNDAIPNKDIKGNRNICNYSNYFIFS